VVLDKAIRSFSGLAGMKKSFVHTMVYEHYFVDMCTYGGKN